MRKKAFEPKGKKKPRLSANRPSNNWAQEKLPTLEKVSGIG